MGGGSIRPRGVMGYCYRLLVEANLLPSLGAVNGTKASYAGLQTEPFHLPVTPAPFLGMWAASPTEGNQISIATIPPPSRSMSAWKSAPNAPHALFEQVLSWGWEIRRN